MPLLEHAVVRALGMHAESVQHPGLADREVGDIDHFLDFAVALGLDLAHLERHEAAEIGFQSPQLLADQAHGLAALRRRHLDPFARCVPRRGDHLLVLGRRRRSDTGDQFAGRGVDRVDACGRGVLEPAAARSPGGAVRGLQAQSLEKLFHYSASCAMRWWPVRPSTTSRDETSLEPPSA
jgi:hypothetical protein